MRGLILFLILLVASVWIGVMTMQHPGYLMVVSEPWMMQMPLWFAVITCLLLLLLFYLIIDSIDRIQLCWFTLCNWWRFRREQRLYNKTQHGLTLLIEGRWKKAERLLLAGIHDTVDPLMNYLGAAKAAQELGAKDRRDEYIKKAYTVAPHAALAIGLTKAELEFSHEQLNAAIITLDQLRELSPRHPRVLTLLERIYIRTSDWQNLLKLLPSMRKAKLLTLTQNLQLEKNVYCEILSIPQKNFSAIQTTWEGIPRHLKKNPDVVYAYVKQLLHFSHTKEAEDLIRKTLKNHWHPELAKRYGTLPFANLNRQLVIVAAWVKMYGQKPELLLTLARLCVKVQLWGRAKDYFEKCLALGPNPDASLAYGHLLEQLNEPEKAMMKYREGMLAVVERSSC